MVREAGQSDLAETNTELYITERANNILFVKEYNMCGDRMKG